MSSTISKEFVDKKLSTLPIVPSEWDVGRGHYYQLDLRMCQIQRIKWGFNWGDESKPLPRIATITEQPSRILKADFSLNELQNLDYEALYPLKHLRVLDASLNRIQRFESIEVLSHLQTLNLSHNFIKRLDGLERSYNLTELNLGMNEIEDISMMPTLTNLTVLYLNNNKLKSLDGVQGLARLRELYVQRNQIVDLVPLLSSRNLIILNAADNHISALQTTGEVLRHLHKLQSITLHGNPIERENLYQAAILDASQVMVLDNISVRNPPRIEADGPYTDSMQGLKGAATQAFHDQIKAKRQQMEENVSFLQQRIKSLQDEFYAYEEKMKNDMEACLGIYATL
ncbi:protein phosphatase 1 regulatory subunit 7-like [Lingula anatina]|uniref:Protein phosphatase 1 regulatory subunit 7-like n=1 Tax=Lingula anatina TaxID=7574 RepID=A0A1S3J759_LINAN|nr:protein phosphatase 1 regulatory subunit 7-like [Lingula anatina]|eukprot:XP_013406235.1 protein phosphatase 1 regulatory subunit 7-like [Lingula anatina]